MKTQYVVWICIEKCKTDGDYYDQIESIGEPRQAGCFRSERLAYKHVECLLEQGETGQKT